MKYPAYIFLSPIRKRYIHLLVTHFLLSLIGTLATYNFSQISEILVTAIIFSIIQIFFFYNFDIHKMNTTSFTTHETLRIILLVLITAISFRAILQALPYNIASIDFKMIIHIGYMIAYINIFALFLQKVKKGRKIKVLLLGKNRQFLTEAIESYPIKKFEILNDEDTEAFEKANIILTSLQMEENTGDINYKFTSPQKFWDEVIFYSYLTSKIPLDYIVSNPKWLLYNGTNPLNSSLIRRSIKQTFDILFAVTVLLITSPLFVIIPILIKLDSKGKVFFLHKRVGFNGNVFKLIKFRTMEDGKRITRVGKWLRLLHLDELPNLINILMGELSLIGPRPVNKKLEMELQNRIRFYHLRYSVKPGIIGWSLANWDFYDPLRNESSSISVGIERFEYDMFYIQNFSLLLDLIIFIKTIKIIILPFLNRLRRENNA